ncbi:MAG: hypothetical protein ABFS37_01405 [Acidobacteriota bacterium]
MSPSKRKAGTTAIWLKIVIWVLAVVLMAGSVIYQRLTGPTHPKRGAFEAAGTTHTYRLVRSGNSTTPAQVRIPDPGGETSAVIEWRRYPTDEEFTPVPMTSNDGMLTGDLPRQVAAGKVEYSVTLQTPEGTVRLPSGDEDTVILRYKDPVPATVLIPHIFLMFFAVLFGIRTGLSAIFAPSGMRWSAWTTLIGMTVGGMVLGPIVQKYAFGAYWTGWPFGGDLTDNKVLIMWIVWILACSTIGFKPIKKEWIGRMLVVAAAAVMTGVYLIPHSMRGSELNYEAVDSGVEASQAIGTSDE